MRPPGGSKGSGRSYAPQSVAPAAWKLAVASTRRRRTHRSGDASAGCDQQVYFALDEATWRSPLAAGPSLVEVALSSLGSGMAVPPQAMNEGPTSAKKAATEEPRPQPDARPAMGAIGGPPALGSTRDTALGALLTTLRCC